MFNGFIISDVKPYVGKRTEERFIVRTKRNELSSVDGIQPHVLYTANVLVYPEMVKSFKSFIDHFLISTIMNHDWNDAQKRTLSIDSLKRIVSNYIFNNLIIIPEDMVVKISVLLNRDCLLFEEYNTSYKMFNKILNDAIDNGGFIVITENTSPTPTESSLPINIDKSDGGHYQSFIF